MSDRRGHLHFKLNYAEEITIKKELERLHKHPQQDFRHAAVESHLGSGLCLPLMQEQPNPYSDQFNSIPSPISGAYRMLFQPTCQSSPEAVVFQKVKSSDQKSRKKQPDLKLRPLAKSARSSSREIIRGSADPKDHLFMQPKAIGSNNKDEKKPAIAALVGTTKSIAVFSRPEPPSKPRSYMPKVSPRPRISLKPLAAQQKERKGPKVVRNAPPKSKKAANVRLLQTPILDSDTSSSSSDSDSEDSSDSGSIKMKIKQKKLGVKRENPLVTHEKERIARRKSVGLGSHPFKTPTTQQFSDVPDTAMTFPQGGQEKSPYESTQGKLSYVLTPPVKTTARSVDEIIASLRSPQIYAASDLMIKQLMESVLGENYIITFGEDVEEKSETQTVEEALSSIELQPPDQILDIAAAQTDDNVVEGVSVPLVGKEDQEEPVLDVSSSTVEIPKTFSQEEITTKEEARSLLKLPTQIAFSDIIHVKGDAAPLARRDTGKIRPPAALLATWEPRSKERGLQTIHHFCTVSPSHVLPSYLQLASRVHHTVDRKGHSIPIEKGVLPKRAEEEHSTNAYSVSNSQAVLKEEIRILQEGLPVSAFQIHDQRDSVITLPPHSARSLEEWQRIAEYYVEGPRIELVGEQALLSSETLRMFWALAPPKFSAPLSLIQKTVFAKYESCLEEQGEIKEECSSMQQESESSEDEQVEPENQSLLERILSRRYNSLPDISSSYAAPTTESVRNSISGSAPNISDHRDTNFHLSADFQTSMKELEMWKEQSSKPPAPPDVSPTFHPEPIDSQVADHLLTLPESSTRTTLTTEKHNILSSHSGADTKVVMKFVSRRKKMKPKKRIKSLDPRKLQKVLEELNQPPQALERSVSLVKLPVYFKPFSAVLLKRPRSCSLPPALDFSCFAKEYGGLPAGPGVREWVRDIWNRWFDEVFPPSRALVEKTEQYFDLTNIGRQPEQGSKEVSLAAPLESVPPVLVEDPMASVEDMESEIARLTILVEGQEVSSAFHCCRRGALNRKLGKLILALQDLDMAIKHEPLLLDAYWHRHLIYLLQGKTSEALDDLNIIVKFNKTHADAYLSKAEIYKQKKDFTLSILNYTQALKCRPTDDDTYFRRAQVYESRDEVILAMDDYAQCFSINPSRTDAIMKHGLYYFEHCNWNGAVQDFSALIKQDFHNVEARTYRGRAYTKLAHYTDAVVDFSAAIHLDPKNWMAFYYRGCLLRKSHPQHALQDFSISVLLHDGYENLNAFLYRGILYTDLGLSSEAAFDFQNVLALDRTVTLAHVNLGLISLLHRNHYSQAIRHFSAAVRLDPIYVQAYQCRAQAYHQINDLHNALKDITRVIHMCPASHQAYILRAQYLYDMKRYDLASFCIHHAAEMTPGSSPVQQALVQSFCQKYNSAFECLLSAIKVKTTPLMMVVLGKIQMKAKKNKDAAESFRRALAILSSSDHHMPSTPDEAEIFYLLGLCYMEQFHFSQAFEALTSAVKARSDFSDAYFQRGLCCMRLQQAKCVYDFNKALEINPKHFQAFLCRAAFYGHRKRYSKAIMNCNAAIEVQPHSVRAYLYRGALKYYIKAYKFAIQDLTKAAELDPSCSLVYYNRGVCYQQTKMYDKAVTDYSTVLVLGGWKEVEIKVLVNRGLVYLELHDYANALEDFQAVALKTPRDINIHQVIGNCYHRTHQYEEAVKAFKQVLQINPLSPEGYIGRGTAYMEYGHKNGTKQAQRDFVSALHLSPKCIAARICLGYNLQAQGFFQQAWNQFTMALDIDAHCMLGFEGRAIVSLQMGDTFSALQDMNAALKLGVTAQLLTNRGAIHQFMGKLHNAMRDYQAALTADPQYPLAYFNAANLYLHNRQFSQ
ncbi:tetratricopeptide repeat protein 6 isoform X2 [Ascaphus truei]